MFITELPRENKEVKLFSLSSLLREKSKNFKCYAQGNYAVNKFKNHHQDK